MQALLTPDAGIYGFPHFRFLQTMISHGAIVTAAVWMTAVEGLRPYPRSIVRVAGIGLAYMVVIGGVNALIGSNYLYIAHKPDTASLLDVMPAWPWYIPYLLLIAALMIGLLYLPFAMKDWRANRVYEQRLKIND
ncbi:MAG: TIGR02206 family membrane protein, partial [Anaerolineae bacterium]